MMCSWTILSKERGWCNRMWMYHCEGLFLPWLSCNNSCSVLWDREWKSEFRSGWLFWLLVVYDSLSHYVLIGFCLFGSLRTSIPCSSCNLFSYYNRDLCRHSHSLTSRIYSVEQHDQSVQYSTRKEHKIILQAAEGEHCISSSITLQFPPHVGTKSPFIQRDYWLWTISPGSVTLPLASHAST